jgi:peptidoglycan/LPS O-acetylase OafA/YrhL
MGLVRFLLAAGVILCHTSNIYGYSPLNGSLAVQCFYIFSGFYMTMVLKEKYSEKSSIRTFYINRALKIYPTYWLVLLLAIIWSTFVFKLGYPGIIHQYQSNWPLSNLTLFYLFIANVLLLGLDWIFLFGLKDGNMYFTSNFNNTRPAFYGFAFNSIAWTIGVELLFYLIAPFIMRKNLFFIVLLLLISLSIRLILAHNDLTFAPWDYMFFPTQLMFFMGGGISYHIYKKLKSKNLLLTIISGLYLLIILFYNDFFKDSYLKQVFLFVSTIAAIPCLFKITKSNKIDKYLGDLSYPMYISQSLIIMVTASKRFPKPFGLGVTVLSLAIVSSILLNHFIIKPINKIRQMKVDQLKLIHN